MVVITTWGLTTGDSTHVGKASLYKLWNYWKKNHQGLKNVENVSLFQPKPRICRVARWQGKCWQGKTYQLCRPGTPKPGYHYFRIKLKKNKLFLVKKISA